MVVSELAAGRGHRTALLLVGLIKLVNACGLALPRQFLFTGRSFRRKIRLALTAGMGAVLPLLFLFFSFSRTLSGTELSQPKRILILYSFERNQTAAAVDLDASLRSSLKSRVPDRIEFYTEYLDLTRFPDPGHADNMVKLLRLRLAGKKLDLIIPVGYAALDFVLKSGKDLFPEIPIVSLFAEPKTGLNLAPDERGLVTGVKGKIDPTRTLDLALQLQPDTERVVVVTGNSPNEKFWLEQHRAILAGYGAGLTVTYLTDLPMDAILKQLADLPPHTIVLYTFFMQDVTGQFFVPEEVLDLMAKVTRVPIYGIYSSYFGHGIVGGWMDDLPSTTGIIADMAARVLSGEKPGDIPMVVDSSSRDRVDWRQLQRWGISERRLPPGTVVFFKEPSIWDRYRFYIVGISFLLILQAFLIIALLLQQQRRKGAEERLRSEKAFSDAVIESLPGIFFMQDETLRNIRWNKNAERIARYHPSEVGRMGNVVEKYKSLMQQKARELFGHGMAVSLEIEMLGPRDTTKHYHISAQRVEMEGKYYAIGIGIDISERKRAEDELRLSEARFSSAFEYAPIGVALVEPSGRWIKVNRAFCDLLGYTAEELCTKSFQEVTHPDDLPAELNYVQRLLTGEIPSYQMEKRYLHKSGKVVWIWLSASLVRDSQGQPLYRISQVQDVTERKRAEQELKQAEERFAKAFRSSPEACAITTLREKRFIEANDTFLRILGFERSEVIGATVDELKIWPHPEERAALIRKILEGGAAREEDVKFRTKWGKTLQIRMSGEIIHLQGEPCLLGLARDVTEQNLLEEQFRQAQKMEAVGRLAGGVAHDFNNLLGVIIGYSELVNLSLPADSTVRKRLEAIKEAGQRAASLTTQLLAFSRKQTLRPRVVNLNSVVTETARLLRPLLGEDIEQRMILDPQLGKVKADTGQIVQVLMNLAVNARDAMPSGGKLIIETANMVVDDVGKVDGIPIQPGPYVVLAVKDTGTGMNEETMARIFEPFFTTKPEGRGTGLGLATVYGIVEQSGGCIVVDSTPGEGTRFEIYLPRTDEVAEPTIVQPVLVEPASASGTVLLVEDELALRTVVDDSLRQEGYSVLLAANGMDALQVAERHKGPIQLLITDVIMPFLSGPELARSLKSSRPDTRVLYMSGYTEDKLEDHAILDPDLALLQKPFKLVDLSRKVRDLLNGNGGDGARAKGH